MRQLPLEQHTRVLTNPPAAVYIKDYSKNNYQVV